jgi:hypothetical protein
VLRPLNQNHAQVGVSLPRDVQLWLALPRVPSARL